MEGLENVEPAHCIICRRSGTAEFCKSQDIVKGVHGRFSSGQLVAIMGPSGAGKSSLLNAISGYRASEGRWDFGSERTSVALQLCYYTWRNHTGVMESVGVSGELLINGRPRDEKSFQKASCYITQEDLLQPLLTVKETMDVAAGLKLPKGAQAHSEQILNQLGLLDHQNTRTEQLSGGQRKRYVY
ncbi:ATP-binding cassette sub-family G member 1 [Eumeta japonica]|uniref:ATP-binding cassette sub-family G member 1 n=1 Tax=Eumeta variegata TaxID=151549 RepID=A0A4C1YIJ8_EUMVA|nr:ATP-binding cassette sub-family G member 1 [Eumeta japonica]